MKQSTETLLNNLHNFYTTHSRSPTKKDFTNYNTYSRRFGSWNNALRAANLPSLILYLVEEEGVEPSRS